MGINVTGRLIVGCEISDLSDSIKEPYEECWYEFAEEHEMIVVSPWYDSEVDDQSIGFEVELDYISKRMFQHLKELSDLFKELTGVEPTLLGLADVW